MKYFKYAALVTLLVFAIGFAQTESSAQGASGTWISSIQVQNLGADDAHVTIDFYKPDGSSGGTGLGNTDADRITISAGSSELFYLPGYSNTKIAAGFKGAAIVSADQPVAAIVNQVTTTTPAYNGSYSGLSVGSPKMYLPAVVRNYYGWNNEIAVQNTDGSSSVAITIKFYNAAGSYISGADKTDTIAAYGVGYYDISTSAYSALGNNFNGSATVSADNGTTNLVVVVNQATANGMMQSYSGFAEGKDTFYAPDLLVGWYGWNSALKVQNVGAQATTITVNYSDGTTANRTLQPNAAYQFYQPAESHAAKWQGAATITTSGGDRKIVAIVSEATGANLAQAQTYEAFGAGGSQVSLPVVMKSHYGWNTAFTVQNLGPGTATIDITYNPDSYGFAGTTYSVTIQEGASKLYYQPGDTHLTANKYNGAVSLEVTSSGQSIVAIVNQVCDGQLGVVTGDWAMSYSGMIP